MLLLQSLNCHLHKKSLKSGFKLNTFLLEEKPEMKNRRRG